MLHRYITKLLENRSASPQFITSSQFHVLLLFSPCRCKWGTFITPSPKCSWVAVSWPSWSPLWCAVCCCCCAPWVGCVHMLASRRETCPCCSNGCSRCGTDKGNSGVVVSPASSLFSTRRTKAPLFSFCLLPLCSCVSVRALSSYCDLSVCACAVQGLCTGASVDFLTFSCIQIITFLSETKSVTELLKSFVQKLFPENYIFE